MSRVWGPGADPTRTLPPEREGSAALVLAATFIGFGFWTLKPDTLDEDEKPHRFGPFVTKTLLFFLAEMGDKTQLATVALAARYQSAFWVAIGTTLGMLASDGLAVFLGEKLAKHAQNQWMRWIAASLFFVFGITSLDPAWTLRTVSQCGCGSVTF